MELLPKHSRVLFSLPCNVLIPPNTFIRFPARCCASLPFPRSHGIPIYFHSPTVRTVNVSFHFPLCLASFHISLSLSLASIYVIISLSLSRTLYLHTHTNPLFRMKHVVGSAPHRESLAGRIQLAFQEPQAPHRGTLRWQFHSFGPFSRLLPERFRAPPFGSPSFAKGALFR